MRVELIYAPGCNLYKSIRDTLETVIAEERLPIPVEMVEDGVDLGRPIIRIDGQLVEYVVATFDQLRDILSCRWRDHHTEGLINRAA
jgi:hypothetical protein